jgi:hypothetical protein
LHAIAVEAGVTVCIHCNPQGLPYGRSWRDASILSLERSAVVDS